MFTKQQELDIIRKVKQRFSLNKIAEIYNCNVKTIAQIPRKYGVVPHAKKFVMTKKQIKEAVYRFNNGESLTKLKSYFKVWQPNLRKVLVANGCKMRLVKHNLDTENKIIQLFLYSGKSVQKIAAIIGVTDKVVYRCIKNLVRIKPKIQFYTPRPTIGFLKLWTKKYGLEIGEKMWQIHLAKHRKNSSGKNNPMYGKPSPSGSGVGWKGWYKNIYFRSLRELMFMLECDKNKIVYKSAEKIIIKYKFLGTDRTYRPDFQINNQIIELKPKRLQKSPNVLAKTKAANRFCNKNGLIYIIKDISIDQNLILNNMNLIKFNGDYKKRFLKYCKDKK